MRIVNTWAQDFHFDGGFAPKIIRTAGISLKKLSLTMSQLYLCLSR